MSIPHKIAMLFLVFSVVPAAFSAVQEDKLVNDILSSSKFVAGKNIFYSSSTEALDREALQNWDKTFNKAKQFINENSKSDKDITDALLSASKINMELVNTLKITDNLLTTAFNINKKVVPPQIAAEIKKEVAIFNQLAADVTKASTALNKASFYLNREAKLKAKTILLALFNVLKAGAEKGASSAQQY